LEIRTQRAAPPSVPPERGDLNNLFGGYQRPADGTFRTWRHVRLEPATGTKADFAGRSKLWVRAQSDFSFVSYCQRSDEPLASLTFEQKIFPALTFL
jgi:hypothetical protein